MHQLTPLMLVLILVHCLLWGSFFWYMLRDLYRRHLELKALLRAHNMTFIDVLKDLPQLIKEAFVFLYQLIFNRPRS
jgi:hypothetical protein